MIYIQRNSPDIGEHVTLNHWLEIIYMLGITHLFPHNELVHLPYIVVATNTRADEKVKSSFL